MRFLSEGTKQRREEEEEVSATKQRGRKVSPIETHAHTKGTLSTFIKRIDSVYRKRERERVITRVTSKDELTKHSASKPFSASIRKHVKHNSALILANPYLEHVGSTRW